LATELPRQISNTYTIALDGLAMIGAAVLNSKKIRLAENPSAILLPRQAFVAPR